MVVLGQRTDKRPKTNRGAFDVWCNRFAILYSDLMCDCNGVLHHAKRVATIERRLNDSEYLEAHFVSAEDRTEAQHAADLHRSGLEAREQRIKDRLEMFPEFWNGRPERVDRWLREWWYAYAPGDEATDPVIGYMLARSTDPCWKELERCWNERGLPANSEPVPF